MKKQMKLYTGQAFVYDYGEELDMIMNTNNALFTNQETKYTCQVNVDTTIPNDGSFGTETCRRMI